MKEKIYHYTKIRDKVVNILESIIQKGAIHLHSSFFRKYEKDDYLWIKNYSKDIVRDICEENHWEYDEGALTEYPYIISFCMDSDSEYMWKNYADKGHGMKLIFDKDLLNNVGHGNPDGHGNYYSAIETTLPCIYINKKEELKLKLLDNMNLPELGTMSEFEKMKFLVSAIKFSKPYKEEQEYRHIHLHDIFGHYYYNDGNPYYEEDVGPVNKDDMWLDLLFPREMLLGIELGENTTEEDLQYVRQHIINVGYDPCKVSVKRYTRK